LSFTNNLVYLSLSLLSFVNQLILSKLTGVAADEDAT